MTGSLVPACQPVRSLVYGVVKGSSCRSIKLRQEDLAFIKAVSTLQLSLALLRELRMVMSRRKKKPVMSGVSRGTTSRGGTRADNPVSSWASAKLMS